MPDLMRFSMASVHSHTSTAIPDFNTDPPLPAFSARPQPAGKMSEEMPERLSEKMSKEMPERMSDRMSGEMSERLSDKMAKEGQKICHMSEKNVRG